MADDNPTSRGHESHGGYSSDYREVATYPEGVVVLLVCNTCHFIEAYCNHSKCTWNTDGTILTCDFCGIDGT